MTNAPTRIPTPIKKIRSEETQKTPGAHLEYARVIIQEGEI
jgi:hypothetical protein